MTGVMDEEEYQKHRVRRGKRDASDHVYGLGDPYRVRRHFALVAAAVAPDILLLLQRKTVIIIIIWMLNACHHCYNIAIESGAPCGGDSMVCTRTPYKFYL